MHSVSDGWQETEVEMGVGGEVCLKWFVIESILNFLCLQYTDFNDSCLMVEKLFFHLVKLCKECFLMSIISTQFIEQALDTFLICVDI